MAPVLQCPDCGTKHPLSEAPERGAFTCRGCGRVLKVPESVAQRSAAAPIPAPIPAPVPAPVPASDSGATQVMPAARPEAAPIVVPAPPVPRADDAPSRSQPIVGGEFGPSLGRVPLWMRLLLWIVAVPASFIVVFFLASAFGVFTHNQMSDLFLATGSSRFWPVARLLPFVALLTAFLVQVGVYLIARLRAR